MLRYLKMCFGLKGSFRWACKQMQKGHIVTFKNITGAVKYRFDIPSNGRIVFAFTHDPHNLNIRFWASANIFMSDVYSMDWVVCNPNKSQDESQ